MDLREFRLEISPGAFRGEVRKTAQTNYHQDTGLITAGQSEVSLTLVWVKRERRFFSFSLSKRFISWLWVRTRCSRRLSSCVFFISSRCHKWRGEEECRPTAERGEKGAAGLACVTVRVCVRACTKRFWLTKHCQNGRLCPADRIVGLLHLCSVQ